MSGHYPPARQARKKGGVDEPQALYPQRLPAENPGIGRPPDDHKGKNGENQSASERRRNGDRKNQGGECEKEVGEAHVDFFCSSTEISRWNSHEAPYQNSPADHNRR